jgi:hypothetical protein
MDKDDAGFMMILAVVAIVCFILGAWMVHTNIQREAVKLGHATWVANEKGEAIFTWNEHCGK